MKRVDFENGTITKNILGTAIPMLAAQILSLLYNIVDRITSWTGSILPGSRKQGRKHWEQ